MIWIARLLRAALVTACLAVLSGIVPISITHYQTGDACPTLGLIPACYVVSVAYAAMAVAALVWWRELKGLFFLGATPVILLAATGTTLEVLGRPTCPKSDNGWPLCYTSLILGVSLFATFLVVLFIERRLRSV